MTRPLIIGAALTALALAAGLLSLAWTPYDIAAIDIAGALRAPSGAHWLGTDQLGRDVASLLMAGAANSIAVALIAVALGAGLGIPLGLAAAAAGGGVDEIIMRANDMVFAFPALLLAILLTAVLGPSGVNAMIAIGVFNVPVFARVARANALTLWSRDFVLAARAAGKSAARISLEHIAPNLADQLIVQATIQFALGLIAEAALSYVGLGVRPPAASWGRMLAESQTYIYLAPWLALAPGLAIFATVLGLNLLGDGLRDRFDPKRPVTSA
jgi:peptide/nickel transport system permease protein